MLWDDSNVLGLSKAACRHCGGYGMRPTAAGREKPCRCVFRAAFLACYHKFRECIEAAQCNAVTLDSCPGCDTRRMFSRKREEYIADFCLVSRRTLDDLEYKVFKYHYLLGAGWKLCCRQMQIDRAIYFRTLYRVQEKLGRTFGELEPYSLYPVDEYFKGPVRCHMVDVPVRVPRIAVRPVNRLRLPLTA